MTSRNEILARVRAKPPAAVALPPIASFERDRRALLQAFRDNLARMGGEYIEAAAGGSLEALVRQRHPGVEVICSATPEVAGDRPLSPGQAPATLNSVDVGVVRAILGVAETGSVLLTETELVVPAVGFLSQHLVVLLDPTALVADLHEAYRHPRFRSAGYAVLMTGPSATADIEGVLVRGAQGIRTLTVIGTGG